MITNYEIKPLIGIDKLIFGLSKEAVKKLLGNADDVDLVKHSDGLTHELWTYNKTQIELSFNQEDDWKLGAIDIFNNDFLIKNTKIIGLDEVKFIEKFEKLNIGMIVNEKTEDSEDYYNYYCEDSNMLIWINNGIVESITLLTEYDEKGINIIWPTQNKNHLENDIL